MKKLLAFILVIMLCISLLVSCTMPESTQGDTESSEVSSEELESDQGGEGSIVIDGNEQTEKEPVIRMLKYYVFYCDVTSKIMYEGEFATSIIERLEALQPTGETVEKISDETVDVYSRDLPVADGTMWIEVGEKIYRIDGETGIICLVERHLGEGIVLEAMSEELRKDLNAAWFYYPRDYYMGTYYNETNEIELKNVYAFKSGIEVNIKDVEILSTIHHDEVNIITVELISTVDGTFDIRWQSEASSDNIGSMGETSVTLTANVPQIVKLYFSGWDDFYWVYIDVSNVTIDLKIVP